MQFLRRVIRNQSFVGMSALFHDLKANGAQFFYVTGAPKLIQALPESFLRKANFPPGTLSLRESRTENMEDSKYQRALEIMKTNPDTDFYLICDNGEGDVLWTERLLENPEVKDRIKLVTVHQLYPEGIGRPLRSSRQVVHTSAADLALQFFKLGKLRFQQLQSAIQAVVVSELKKDSSSPAELAAMPEAPLPDFTPISAKTLVELDEFGSSLGDRPLAGWVKALGAIYRRFQQNPVPQAWNAERSCHGILTQSVH